MSEDIPDFVIDIVRELLSNKNSLLIISPGLSERNVINSLIKLYSNSKKLVFLLNNSQNNIFDECIVDGINYPRFITSQFDSNERVEMFKKGGVFCVTSRILVVDLLRHHIPINAISGLIILNAHQISSFSPESFIIEMFDENNIQSSSFIHAISTVPQAFSSSFDFTPRVINTLRCSNLLLWPRFREEVIISNNFFLL
jgi:DNA excision repair protein ERCC-4